MPKDKKDQQTEQTPTGYTVPVPKRDEFFGNLKKAAKPSASKPAARSVSVLQEPLLDDPKQPKDRAE